MEDIKLNNAQDVLNFFSADNTVAQEGFLTMVQGNAYSDVEITENNIKNNSNFIVSIWD